MTMTATLTKVFKELKGKTRPVYVVKIFSEDGSLYDVQESIDLELVLKRTLRRYAKITIVVELSK